MVRRTLLKDVYGFKIAHGTLGAVISEIMALRGDEVTMKRQNADARHLEVSTGFHHFLQLHLKR